MGRELKRVSLDFCYPIDKVWRGYSPDIETFKSIKGFLEKAPYLNQCKSSWDICGKCDEIINNCSESAKHCLWYNKDNKKEWFKEVPVGEGYQLWETTTEGSPKSPVFKTLEELCGWCEINATTFSNFTATKEEWFDMLNEDSVHQKAGSVSMESLKEKLNKGKEKSFNNELEEFKRDYIKRKEEFRKKEIDEEHRYILRNFAIGIEGVSEGDREIFLKYIDEESSKNIKELIKQLINKDLIKI